MRYGEGDWFAIPLRDGGFAIGVIARANHNGVLFGYFFGPKRSALPTTSDLTERSATAAVLVTTFEHLGLRDGKWPLIESATEWNREEWPMPTFGRFEESSGRAFAVEYRDDDPNSRARETQIDLEDLSRYPRDGLSGAGAVATHMLCWFVIGGNELGADNLLGAFGILCAMNGASRMIGHRVLVDGMMGSGKSTFARALAARTGLPVIHLDVHYWKRGWVRPSDDEWRERQRALLGTRT